MRRTSACLFLSLGVIACGPVESKTSGGATTSPSGSISGRPAPSEATSSNPASRGEPETSKPPRPTGAVLAAFARASCAPWDGGALQITIPTGTGGTCDTQVGMDAEGKRVMLWREATSPVAGKTIEIGKDGHLGQIADCLTPKKCTFPTGSVTFDEVTPDVLRGHLMINAPGGTTDFAFDAKRCPGQAICG